MSDILIRGVEMPKSCAKCDLFGEYGCPFIGAVGYALTQGRRNEDCPLIELPPHGDLIDRDAAIDDLKLLARHECDWRGSAILGVVSSLKSMNAIVPAERSEP